MKYITISSKDYSSAKLKNLDVIPSSNISLEKDFHKLILNRTNKVLDSISIKEILTLHKLPECLSHSLKFHLKFFLHQIFFEDELEKRSKRLIWKFHNKRAKNLLNSINKIQFLNSMIFSLINHISILCFKILLFLRSINFKEVILLSHPHNGLEHAIKIHCKKDIKYLYIVSNKKKFLLSQIIKFIIGGNFLPFYPRIINNHVIPGVSDFTNNIDNKISKKKINLIISNWILNRKRDFEVIYLFNFYLKPKSFISQQSLDRACVVSYILKKIKIPTLLIPHGSFVYNSDPIARQEWKNISNTMFNGPFSYSSIQSPAAKKFNDSIISEPIGLESFPYIIWNNKNEQKFKNRNDVFNKHSNKIIILYASTPKYSGALRPYLYETEDEYINNLSIFIKSLSHRTDIHLAIRHKETNQLKASDLLTILPKSNNIKIYHSGKFEDYLLSCDLLVSYSSTTIEQALFASKKVLLWDSKGSYNHFSKDSLNIPNLNGVWFASKSNLSINLQKALDFDLNQNYQKTYQEAYQNFFVSNFSKNILNKFV